MHHETILRLSLFLSIFLFILCLTTTLLTTVYWILSDWLVFRYITVLSAQNKKNEFLLYYMQTPTDASIVSGCVGMATGVVAFLAWYKLRRADMDFEHNMPRRRFWIGFVYFMAIGCCGVCIATLALYYTTRAKSDTQCTITQEPKAIQIYECTREIATCSLLPSFPPLREMDARTGKLKLINSKDQKRHDMAVGASCKTIGAVKWLQVVIALTCVTIAGLIGLQAQLRRKTRLYRPSDKEPMRFESSEET